METKAPVWIFDTIQELRAHYLTFIDTKWDVEMEEKKRQAKTVADQFKNELVKLAQRTDTEIQQLLDDYEEVMKSAVGEPPSLSEYLGTYDNMIIVFIQNLLQTRTEKRDIRLKRRIAELEKE